MNFNPNPYDSHKACDMTSFTATLDGWYEASAPMLNCEPIPGAFQTLPNPNREWWQFWKPKFILKQECRTWITYSGQQVLFLKKGDVLPVPKTGFSVTRIGS